jgi:uncharacterized SAM-binding protein YcdF (DUF218 family)
MHRLIICVAVVIAILLLSTAVFFIYGGQSNLTVSTPLKSSDAIVLLAGSYEERAPMAVSLYHAGYAPRVILVNDGVRKGWSREHQRNLYSIERNEIDLVKRGVPVNAITRLPFRKSGTVYDALAVRDCVINQKLRSIILVTSDYHTHRSLWIFKRVMRQLPVIITIASSPSKESFITKILLEYVKLVYYRLRFGLMN